MSESGHAYQVEKPDPLQGGDESGPRKLRGANRLKYSWRLFRLRVWLYWLKTVVWYHRQEDKVYRRAAAVADPVGAVKNGYNPRFSVAVFRLCKEAERFDTVVSFTNCEIWVTEILLNLERDLKADPYTLSWLLIVRDEKDRDGITHISFSELDRLKKKSPRGIGGYKWEALARMHAFLFL